MADLGNLTSLSPILQQVAGLGATTSPSNTQAPTGNSLTSSAAPTNAGTTTPSDFGNLANANSIQPVLNALSQPTPGAVTTPTPAPAGPTTASAGGGQFIIPELVAPNAPASTLGGPTPGTVAATTGGPATGEATGSPAGLAGLIGIPGLSTIISMVLGLQGPSGNTVGGSIADSVLGAVPGLTSSVDIGQPTVTSVGVPDSSAPAAADSAPGDAAPGGGDAGGSSSGSAAF